MNDAGIPFPPALNAEDAIEITAEEVAEALKNTGRKALGFDRLSTDILKDAEIRDQLC